MIEFASRKIVAIGEAMIELAPDGANMFRFRCVATIKSISPISLNTTLTGLASQETEPFRIARIFN